MDTSRARSAPAIGAVSSTRSSSARSPGSSAASPLKIAARIAPRSRRCRVSARVPGIAMPTTPWSRSADPSEPVARQLDATRAGSRTTYPATWIRPDSGSSSLTPVLPMCGAVIATICRA